jgi:hypothetical protein
MSMSDAEPGTTAITTKTKDYMGRTLLTISTNAKDYMGRATTTTVDYLGRTLLT